MKKKLVSLLSGILLIALSAFSQKVGIGATVPIYSFSLRL